MIPLFRVDLFITSSIDLTTIYSLFFDGPSPCQLSFSFFGERSGKMVLMIQFSSVYAVFDQELGNLDYLLSFVFAAVQQIHKVGSRRFQRAK